MKDLSVAENGELWVALGKEVRVLSPAGAVLRTRTIDADLVSATAGGAWIADHSTLTRLDGALRTLVAAPAFPRPSRIVSLAADPRDGSVFAAALKRIRHVGPAGELLADALFENDAKVKAQHAVALRLDRTPPTLAFLSPTTGSCTGDVRVPLVVAFDDVGAGPDQASLAFFTAQGPLAVACTFVLPGQAFCTPVSHFPEGSNAVSATIADLASVPNLSLPGGTSFVVDSIAPTIRIARAPLPALTNVAAFSFGGTLSEPALLTVNGAPVPVSDALTWNASVTLVEGTNAFELLARDCANVGRLSFTVVLDTVPPAAPDGGLIFVSESIAGFVQIRGEPGSAEPGTTVTALNQRTGASQQTLVRADGSFEFLDFPAESGDSIAFFLQDAAGNVGASSAASVPGTVGGGLPPDPSLVAPPFDPSLAGTDFFAATSFLFSGTDPIQTGVTPGAISPERIVVLRGRVQDTTGLPIAGARISFVGRPEYGQTLSRADGAFDLAANGGGDGLLLSYVAPGFLQVQRRAVGTPWRDYVILPDVVLTAVDPAVSAIDFSGSAPGWQVHLGSGVTDGRGFRRNAVLFPPAIMGDLTWNDGRREALFLGHVHSTEFTVGPNGERAMPGNLPPTSAYTWSAEYSTEEERDSDSFVFSQPIFSYLIDDFLLVEPGTPIPLGSWDRTRGVWVPEANGLVVRLLGVSGGLAMLDVDGTGIATSEAALASLGITAGEREQVATLFPVGATLWRMPLAHFTQPLDGNFGRGPSPDAVPLGDATPAPTPVSVFFADGATHRVRRIGPDGRIWGWAGTGSFGNSDFSNEQLGDGGPATEALLFSPRGLALTADGTLLIADHYHFRVRAVGPDGVIRTIAGGGQQLHCEGCRAVDSRVLFPTRVGVRPEGTILFSTPHNDNYDPVPGNRIRQIALDGRVTTLNDSAKHSDCFGAGAGAGRSIGATCVGGVSALESLPDGNLLLGQTYNGINFVRRVAPVLAGFSTSDAVVPSADARQLYLFDVEGRHTATRDALTGVTELSFGYDGAGRLSQVTDASGNVTRVERGAGGVVTALIAPGGQRTDLAVDLDGYLSSVANDAGETFSLSVGFGGLVEEFRRPRGNATRYLWDRGFLSRWEDAAGGFQSLTRTHTEGVLSLAHGTAEGRLTTYRVEGSASSGAGEQRTNTFPDGTAVAQVRGPDELLTVSRADGTRSRMRRDPDPRFGMKAAFSGFSETRMPSGLAMGVQRTRSVVSPSGDVLAPPTSSTDTVTVGATGRTWTTTYAAGPPRTRTSVSAEGRTAVATLDAQGRVVRSRAATLAPVTFVYRADGLLTSTVHGESPDARSSAMTYDARRQLASVTDALGRTTSFERDLSGRVTRQVLSDGREILTAYDANGNVTSVTPPSRPEHRFAFTPVDLQQSYDPPDVTGATPGVTNYAYDLDRRLVRAVRPDGAAIDLVYLAPGQKLSEVAHAASTATYSYEPGTGKLASIAESATGSTLSYAYDGSLLLSETMSGPIAGQVSNAFDGDFRVREERVNGTHPIAIGYDRDSLPTQVGDLFLSYDPETGLLGGTTLGAVSTTRANNAFAEPVAERAQVGAAEVLAFGYTRDVLGRITELRETIDGVQTPRAFTYDSAGRLTDVHANGFHVAQWTYDGNSNRLSATTPLGTVTAEYDAQDRLMRYGDAFFAYSANGELTTRTDPSGTTSYAYDAMGNLRHVGLPDGRAIDYLIDARNRRVGKRVNGILVQGWLYRDQLEPVAELDGAGNVVARFVYATKAHAPDYMVKDGRTYRVLSDHLGSPRMVVDVDTGAVVQRMDFDPWGVVTLDTNPGWQPFGFAGALWDADTGLTRFGARDYAAAEGRWTAKDPIGFGGGDANLFGYVVGDPINFIDTTGNGPQRDACINRYGFGGLAVGAAAGAAAGATITVGTGGVGIVVAPAPVAGGAILGGLAGLAWGTLVCPEDEPPPRRQPHDDPSDGEDNCPDEDDPPWMSEPDCDKRAAIAQTACIAKAVAEGIPNPYLGCKDFSDAVREACRGGL